MSFTNLDLESFEAAQISFNFINRQINQHASNLRCILFSCKIFDMFKDEFSNLCLVVGISWYDSGLEQASFHIILLLGSLMNISRLSSKVSHRYTSWLRRHLWWMVHLLIGSSLLLRISSLYLLTHLVGVLASRRKVRSVVLLESSVLNLTLMLRTSLVVLLWLSLRSILVIRPVLSK